MPANSESDPVSRRDRPAKTPLSRELIVDKAFEILARDGVSGLSMRKVAAGVDTGPASLYVYVQNLQQLHQLLLDRVLGEIDVECVLGLGGEWKVKTVALAGAYHDVLCRYKGLAQLALPLVPSGPNALQVMDGFLGLFAEGGLEDDMAAQALDTVLMFTTASAAEQTAQNNTGDSDPGAIRAALQAEPADSYPNLRGVEPYLQCMSRDRFAWGLSALLVGIIG